LFANVETETYTAGITLTCTLKFAEDLEQCFLVGFTDPDTGILNLTHQMA
jgi:hypothetical protein